MTLTLDTQSSLGSGAICAKYFLTPVTLAGTHVTRAAAGGDGMGWGGMGGGGWKLNACVYICHGGGLIKTSL